jgi:HlyD family secretion protein
VLAVFFVGFLGWAALAPLDAAVVAPGVVVVSGSRQTLQHREGGTITAIDVTEGQHVKAGQILVELSAPSVLAEERSLFAEVVDLQMQRAGLLAEIAGQPRVAQPAEWASLSPEDRPVAQDSYNRYLANHGGGRPSSEYSERIIGLQNELVSVDRQSALANEELTGMRRLADQGMAPLTRVRSLERDVAGLDGRKAELRANIAAARESRASDLSQIESRLANEQPRLAGLREQLERMRMRAPVDGTVMALNVHTIGGVVGAGERVLDIVPEHQPLIIEAQVRPEDADDLKVGMTTEVRITAFRGRRLPILNGFVREISADRMEDARTGRAYFRAQVEVSPTEIRRAVAALASGGQFRAGLPAEIIVPERKRTALQYLLEPLNQALWRSFREN